MIKLNKQLLNIGKLLTIGVCSLSVSACNEKDPMKVVDNAILESQRVVLVASNFDYKGFITDASFRMKDFSFNRYPDNYKLNLRTYGESLTVLENIKGLCSSTFACKVLNYSNWKSSFVANDSGRVTLVLPSDTASSIIAKIIDAKSAGLFVEKNDFLSTPFDKDITLYTLKIEAYKNLRGMLNTTLQKTNGDLSRIKAVEGYLSEIDFRIASIQKVLNYMNGAKPYAKIDVEITKQYSSIFSMMYDKTVQGLSWFFKYFNYVLLIALTLLFIKFAFIYIPRFVDFIFIFLNGIFTSVKEKVKKISVAKADKKKSEVTKETADKIASEK